MYVYMYVCPNSTLFNSGLSVFNKEFIDHVT